MIASWTASHMEEKALILRMAFLYLSVIAVDRQRLSRACVCELVLLELSLFEMKFERWFPSAEEARLRPTC